MALRNPYSEYGRAGDEDSLRRDALLNALAEPEPPPARPSTMTARPRTPPPIEQTREKLSGPGGRTTAVDQPDTANMFTGDRWQDERQEPAYQPPSTTPTGAQPSAAEPFQSNMGRGYQLMDEYDDAYTRRNEGAGGVWSNAAKYAQTGAAVGSAFAGVGAIPGAIIGGIGGAIGGAFSKNAKTAMTDFAIDDAKKIISQAHEDAFGRPITPEYLDQILQGQGWQQGDRWMGQDSLAYVLDAFASQAPGERQAQAAANAAAAQQGGAAATPAAASAGGTGGGLPFSGFDFNRAQDPSKSAKDAFAAAAQNAPPMTDTSKAGAEAWFREHIAPQMEAAGYKIYDLQGDKAWVGSREDPEGKTPVDWLINAGGTAANAQDAYAQLAGSISPNASKEEMESAIAAAFGHLPGYGGAYKESVMLNGQWYDLVRGYGGPGAEFQGLTPKGESGGGTAVPTGGGLGGTSLANLAPGVQLASPLGQSDVNKAIQEALARIISGAPDRDALLAELGVG